MSDRYTFKENFTVEFTIEADSYDKAYKAYSQMFDKNIQLGYDKWRDVENKNILVGQFEVKTESIHGEEEWTRLCIMDSCLVSSKTSISYCIIHEAHIC